MRITSILTAISLSLAGVSMGYAQSKTLAANSDYKSGISALTDHLNEIAIQKFSTALKVAGITTKDKQQLLLLIGEAHLLANQPALAKEKLSNKLLSGHPDQAFWLGQATAMSGKFGEAVTILEKVTKDSAHYDETKLCIANLYSAIGAQDQAFEIYQELAKQKKTLSAHAAFSLAELYLRDQNTEKATAALAFLPSVDELSPADAKTKQLIQAQINKADKKYPETISSLSALLKSREYLTARAYNTAILTLADARYENGEISESLNDIISFIDENPESSMLAVLFERIQQWLPDETKLTDPVIEKLKKWAGRDIKEQPETVKSDHLDLQAYSHFHYAKFLARGEELAYLASALEELNILKLKHPTHVILGRSLTETAKIQLKLAHKDRAIKTLQDIQQLKTPISTLIKQRSAFIEGQLSADKMQFNEAAIAFENAAQTSPGPLSDIATINAGLAHLTASNIRGFETLLKKTDTPIIKQQLQLEKALWLAGEKTIASRIPLEQYSNQYPDCPRIIDARLALARNCIRVNPVDTILCKKMMELLNVSRLKPEQLAEYTSINYLLAMSTSDYPRAVEIATNFLETHPESDRTIEFRLLKGQALYSDGRHYDAREELRKIAANNPESSLAHYALYYAALAARQEGTPQSQKDAIEYFQKVINSKSPIANEATLQLADLYKASNEPEKSYTLLKSVYKPDGTTSIQRNIAIIMAESLQDMAITDAKYYDEAISVYDKILSQKELPIIWFNRIHYHKAFIYDKINKHQEAINTYYAVINIDHLKNPIKEWHWYYKCGENAIKMLEKLGNPKAAIAIAKRLAASNGPNAKKYSLRARKLEMKHMIWER